MIELGQFEVNFHPRTVTKGQALAHFILEFTHSNTAEVIGMANSIEVAKATGVREKENLIPTEGDTEQWTLYVDDSSNDTWSRTGMMLISPEEDKIHCVIRFGFKALNNEAKYEALIASLHLVH